VSLKFSTSTRPCSSGSAFTHFIAAALASSPNTAAAAGMMLNALTATALMCYLANEKHPKINKLKIHRRVTGFMSLLVDGKEYVKIDTD
jgi:urease beta subunit